MLANPFNIVKKVFDGITLLQQQKNKVYNSTPNNLPKNCS